MGRKLELIEGDEALDRFTKALKSIFSIPRKDAERIRRDAMAPKAMKVARSVPDTATVALRPDEDGPWCGLEFGGVSERETCGQAGSVVINNLIRVFRDGAQMATDLCDSQIR